MDNITHEVFEDELPRGKGLLPAAYIIEHPKSGLFYVGSTGEAGQRRRAHLSTLKLGKNRNHALQEAYNDDPELRFTFVLSSTKEEALALEQKLIDHHYGDPKLANVAPNAQAPGLGLVRSEETRLKIGEAGKGREPWNKGQTLSPIHLERVIASRDKISRKVCVEEVEYPSVSAASRALGVQPSCVVKRIASQTDQFKNYRYSS
jgi:hypothetical protein